MHRRETIMAAVQNALTGLTTTGANVQRARAYAVPALPGISIEQGADTRHEEFDELPDYARRLTVDVNIYARATTNLETILNQVSAEIHAALMAAYPFALNYLHDINPVADSAPEIAGDDTETPVARLTSTWAIDYQHSEESTES